MLVELLLLLIVAMFFLYLLDTIMKPGRSSAACPARLERLAGNCRRWTESIH